MQPLAVIRHPNTRQARGWVHLDGRWRRCSRGEVEARREFATYSVDLSGWMRASPLPGYVVTLRAVLAEGPVALEVDHAEAEYLARRNVIRLRGPGPWRVSAGEMAGGRLV